MNKFYQKNRKANKTAPKKSIRTGLSHAKENKPMKTSFRYTVKPVEELKSPLKLFSNSYSPNQLKKKTLKPIKAPSQQKINTFNPTYPKMFKENMVQLTVCFSNFRYYISDLVQNSKEFMEDEYEIDYHLSHFLQSLSTFHRLQDIKMPKKPSKSVKLDPIKDEKITIIFDMDETLIHTLSTKEQEEEMFCSENEKVNFMARGQMHQISINIRPYTLEVLKRLKSSFEIGLFTASEQDYAKGIISKLDPFDEIFSFKLFRQHCHLHQMNNNCMFVKDLRILENRNLSKVILVDNSPHTYVYQKSNGIPIVSYLCDEKDTELLKLQQFLQKFKNCADVKKHLKKHFRLEDYHKFNNMNELIRELYE